MLVAPLLGLLGVTIAELVPDGRIGHHLVRAKEAGLLSKVERPPSPLGTITDRFSECVAITVGLGDRPGANLLDRALRSPSYVGCARAMPQLDAIAGTGELPVAPSSYLRYWHGYAVVTRPSIGLFGLGGARWVGLGILAIAVTGLAAAVKRSFGLAPAVLLVVPPLLTSDMIVGGLTLSQSIGMASAWLGGWTAFAATRRWPSWWTAAVASALAGAINAYLDLMTSIPGSLALAAVGAALGYVAARSGARVADVGRVTVAGVVGWGVGLAWMWASKWLLAAAVIGWDETVDNVRSQIEFRLAGDHGDVSDNRVNGLTDNIGAWWDQPLTPWVLGALAVAVCVLALRAWSRRALLVRFAWPVAVALPVAGWYVLLDNHSQIHYWLVYRSLPMALGAIAACAAIATNGSETMGRDITPALGLASVDHG